MISEDGGVGFQNERTKEFRELSTEVFLGVLLNTDGKH